MKRRGFLAGLAGLSIPRAHASALMNNAKALSGGRFVVGDAEFLLADIIAPPLYTLKEKPPAHFEQSKTALQRLLSGQFMVEDVLAPTRWRARRVKVKTQDEGALTLQEKLIVAGAARVAPQTDDHAFIRKLFALESDARAAGRGLWAMDEYRVFDALKARGAIGAFNLVEGAVLHAEKHGNRFYLNFGENFRTDFTAGAAARIASRWLKDGFDLAVLKGEKVMVRGHVEAINGPSIDLTHPLQIMRLA